MDSEGLLSRKERVERRVVVVITDSYIKKVRHSCLLNGSLRKVGGMEWRYGPLLPDEEMPESGVLQSSKSGF